MVAISRRQHWKEGENKKTGPPAWENQAGSPALSRRVPWTSTVRVVWELFSKTAESRLRTNKNGVTSILSLHHGAGDRT